MLVGSVLYAVACILVSFFFMKFTIKTAKFALGVVIATAALNVNFELLGYFTDVYLKSKNYAFSAVIYIGRLLIYAVLAVICFFIGRIALVGFAVGMIGVTPGIFSILIKEARGDNES